MKARVIKGVNKVIRRFVPELRYDKKSLRYLLAKRAIETSVAFVERHMLFAQPFETRQGVYRYVMRQIPEKGLILEFGVNKGYSINALATLTDRTVHGFDSFEGLPDDAEIPTFSDGGQKWFKGKMDRGGSLPEVRENVRLHKGWFDAVLPDFYRSHNEAVALMHIDSDIYTSAKCVLDCSREHIVDGTIIIFDEYLNYEGWQRHEHRALLEFAAETGLSYEFIAYNYDGGVAIKVLGYDKAAPGPKSILLPSL